MVAPSYTTDLTPLLLEFPSTTGWTIIGVGALTAPETDVFIQGANSISKVAFSSSIKGMIYNMGGGQTIESGDAVFMWLYYMCPNALAIETDGGLRVIIGSATTAYKHWYVRGSDTYKYGGWICVVVDPTLDADFITGSPTGTLQYFGALGNVPGAGPAKGNPLVIDAFRHGRDLICINGDESEYATFAGAAAKNDANDATNGYNRWGLFQAVEGGYLMQGRFIMGQVGTAVDFKDSNRSISIANLKKVQAAFNGFEVINASSRVDWTNISIAALGTISKGTFSAVDNATINFNTCTFTDMDTFVFKSNSTILGTTFRRCGQITQNSAVFTNCRFESSTAAKALMVNDITKVTYTPFISSGTGYAIEGFSSAGEYILTGLTFSGYATNAGTPANRAIHVLATTGTVKLSIVGGGNEPSIHSEGATVNVVLNEVTMTVTVKTLEGANIQNANVLVLADAGGPMPYNAIVTITRSDSTATVSHTAHGMADNDKVQIKGANQQEYNGVFTITKINDNSYSYEVSGTPATPATGTIKATYAALFGLTNASGVIAASRVFSADQPITGRARKSTGSPFYKTSSIVGTISSATGFATTIQMISDE